MNSLKYFRICALSDRNSFVLNSSGASPQGSELSFSVPGSAKIMSLNNGVKGTGFGDFRRLPEEWSDKDHCMDSNRELFFFFFLIEL